jgi:hypothetical protein
MVRWAVSQVPIPTIHASAMPSTKSFENAGFSVCACCGLLPDFALNWARARKGGNYLSSEGAAVLLFAACSVSSGILWIRRNSK